MLPEYFAIVGAIIASVGGISYLIDTIRGKVKPNRVTWILWGLFPLITFAAQRSEGVGGLSWVSFAAAFTPLLIFAASFLNSKAYWKTEVVDYYCLAFGLVGIALWAVTKNANLAILFSILADLSAGIPTIRKSYTHPHTESWKAFGLVLAGFTVSLLSIHEWTFANYAFVVYLVLINVLLTALAIRRPEAARV